MQGLIGKIIAGKIINADNNTQEIRFKPAAVLPLRASVPEWLKDKTLTAVRSVQDARELGEPGDSIVFSPVEAERWLRPLTVTPSIIDGDPPDNLQITLAWWHEDTPPQLMAVAAGRRIPVELSRNGDRFTGTVPIAALRGAAGYPEQISIEGAGLKTLCAFVPSTSLSAQAIELPYCRGYRLKTPWLSLDVATDHHVGCIAGLTETGREINHFAVPHDITQIPFELGGQFERVKFDWNWDDTPRGQKAVTTGTRQEGGAIRLDLQGIADPGREMRTSAVYVAYKAIPLVTVQREYSIHPKADEKDDGKLKEPIDQLSSPSLGFRSATIAERNGMESSRVLLHTGSELVSVRGPAGEMQGSRSWVLREGWAMVEHSSRRSYILHLFDTDRPPTLKVWNAAREISVEPQWHAQPVAPGDSFGITTGIVAGQWGGASAAGAWVAVRRQEAGGIRWAVIARFSASAINRTVKIVAGQTELSGAFEPFHVSGIGTIYTASFSMRDDIEADPVHITVTSMDSKGQSVTVMESRGLS